MIDGDLYEMSTSFGAIRGGLTFAPGGIHDYGAPILPTFLPVSLGGATGGSGWWPGTVHTQGAVLPSILGAVDVIGDVVGSIPRSAPPAPPDQDDESPASAYEEEPQPDPESIYANLPPLRPDWQDVDVFEESENDFEEEAPPAFIPIDAAGGDELEPREEEEENMPSFWDYASDVVDVFQGQAPGGASLQRPYSGPYMGPTTPTGQVRIDPRTGRPVCKRRRRRRLLTESDFNDLMRIATLPNKQNVTVALAKAIGRRS